MSEMNNVKKSQRILLTGREFEVMYPLGKKEGCEPGYIMWPKTPAPCGTCGSPGLSQAVHFFTFDLIARGATLVDDAAR